MGVTMVRIFGGGKLYRLKGRKDGKWEVLEEYESYMKPSDIREDLQDYINEGYDYLIMEECNEDGSHCRKRWAKKVKPKKQEEDISELTKRLQEYNKLKEEVKKILGIEEPKPDDLVATIIYYRSLILQLFKSLGIPENVAEKILSGKIDELRGGGSGRFSDLKELFDLLRELRGLNIPFMPRQPQQYPYPPMPYPYPYAPPPYPYYQPQVYPPAQPQVPVQENTSSMPMNTGKPLMPSEMPKDVQELASKVVEEAIKQTQEALTPPCAKGKCEEEE